MTPRPTFFSSFFPLKITYKESSNFSPLFFCDYLPRTDNQTNGMDEQKKLKIGVGVREGITYILGIKIYTLLYMK